MRDPLAFKRHVLYASTILDTWLGLQKNCHEHQQLSPLGSTDALRAHWINSLRHIMPVPPGVGVLKKLHPVPVCCVLLWILSSYHSCLCGGRGGCTYLHGQMGHKIWVLEIGRGRRRRMEFFLCVIPAPRRTNLPRGTHLTSNGMSGITPILLRGLGNSKGRCTGLL